MNRHVTPFTHEESGQPAFDARLVRRGPKLRAPAGDFAGGHARNLTIDPIGERGTGVALRVDEPDQECAVACVRFMKGVWPDPGRTIFPPWLLRRATYP